MHSGLKLHFLKQVVNFPVRFLDRFLPMPKPRYPQTAVILDTYAIMQKAYADDVLQDVFREKDAAADGNFERMLRVSVKVLAAVSERDRYYRAWLGFFILLTNRQLQLLKLDPATLKRLIKEQWENDIDFLPDEMLQFDSNEFVETVLANHLGNYVHKIK